MVNNFDSILNRPMPLFFVVMGTIFLTIAVVGKSKLAVFEINPGGFGRFLGLILGIGFYGLAFFGFVMPLESWQSVADTIRTQLQENLQSFNPAPFFTDLEKSLRTITSEGFFKS